ncbi:MAG: alpha/beta hydrolase, partial [Lentisphaeria bacterium]|nr:alpha/beta hydrolase [Lentisphaeria bacterium]
MLDPKYNYIMVPGYGGSGENSWQTHWEKLYPQIVRVEQDNWDFPEREAWVQRLVETVDQYNDKPVILITHSLGCGTTIHAIDKGLLNNI